MILTIAGKLGSGKSTICNILKERYGFEVYSTGEIQRQIASEMGIDILELNELAKKDKQYDDLVDNRTKELAKELGDKNIIFDSRMAWHFIPGAFNIYTTLSPTEAARRVMASDRGKVEVYTSVEDAEEKLLQRSLLENERFKNLYNVNNLDYSNYNLVIDTTWATPEVIADMIITEAEKIKGFNTKLLLSPKSLYPTDKMTHISMDIVNNYISEFNTTPIDAATLDNDFYVVNGHHRLIAALHNGYDFITANLTSPTEYPIANVEKLKTELKYVGLSTLYDYEDIGHFQYKKYPKYYKD